MLLLGAVMSFEPVNAYQLRRELVAWRIDVWAHINPGSIYSGLSTLHRQGLVRRTDDGERSRTAVYATTAAGQRTFQELMQAAIETVELANQLALDTAIALLPLIARENALRYLRNRLTKQHQRATSDTYRLNDPQVPHNATALVSLWALLAEAETRWLSDLIARIEAGELEFRGEAGIMEVPYSDPQWQSVRERVQQQALLSTE